MNRLMGLLNMILKSKQPRVSSCPSPLCTACQHSKQNHHGAGTSLERHHKDKDQLLRRDDELCPGWKVLIDQYVSSVPGCLPHTKGKESPKDKFNGGTIFVHHYIHLTHQVFLPVGETLHAKHSFKKFAATHGVCIEGF
jgi:hypothetical protein